MSLFKQPSWRQNSRGDSDDNAGGSQDSAGEDDLFRHSNSFQSIVADSEKQRREREEKKRRQQQREEARKARKEENARLKRTSTGNENEGEEDDDDDHEVKVQDTLKRRRITAEDSAALLVSIGVSSPVVASARKDSVRRNVDDDDDETDPSPVRQRVSRAQGSQSRPGAARRSPIERGAGVSAVDSSDDDIQFVRAVVHDKPVPAQPPPPPIELDEDSDPEIAALARKARARAAEAAKQKESSDTTATTTTPDAPAVIEAAAAPAELPDAKISIFITSPIEGTNPLMVYRRLSQRLQEVKQAWCQRQAFSPAVASSIILVYRERRRLWDVTTCRSLGLEADAHGNVTLREDPTQTGVDQVHLEAMTEEMFENLRAEKARQALLAEQNASLAARGTDLDGNVDDNGSDLESSPPPAAREHYLRLTIKAKAQSDFKIKVKEDTAVHKIIKAARRAFQIAADQSVYLEFDGERLEPDAKVSDTEIEDMVGLDLFFSD